MVIGNTEGSYGNSVEHLLSKSDNRILRFASQPYLDLARFYQVADLSVFPRQCSLSFFEVQSCGLPVVFENNEVNAQRAQFRNALVFAPDNPEDFRQKMTACVDMPDDEFSAMKINARKYIVDNYDYLHIAQQFTDVLEQEVRRFIHSRGH
jgi:glycosyltransferase involved in cell wall biosynthesis